MNEYAILIRTILNDKIVGYNYFVSKDMMTETIECAVVGKKVTMKKLMKSLRQQHRTANRLVTGPVIINTSYKLSLVKYAIAYSRESVQRVIEA